MSESDSPTRKFVEGCTDCEEARKKIRHLWVLVWPTGELMNQSIGIPAAFYTKEEAVRFRRNSTYETPQLMKFEVKL